APARVRGGIGDPARGTSSRRTGFDLLGADSAALLRSRRGIDTISSRSRRSPDYVSWPSPAQRKETATAAVHTACRGRWLIGPPSLVADPSHTPMFTRVGVNAGITQSKPNSPCCRDMFQPLTTGYIHAGRR